MTDLLADAGLSQMAPNYDFSEQGKVYRLDTLFLGYLK